MKIPTLIGTIRRRLLINFRVDPIVIRHILPPVFQPKLHHGSAIAGICLIRLEDIRPEGMPWLPGLYSENAAHRVAVEWIDAIGHPREGVFIWRRDTDSKLSRMAGGRLFPGEHNGAQFQILDDGSKVDFQMKSDDGKMGVHVQGREAAELPTSSSFASLDESSRFFEKGCIGYSVTRDPHRWDGLRLETREWRVRAFAVESVESSIFADAARFPSGSVTFDHALVMRDIRHEWHAVDEMIMGEAR